MQASRIFVVDDEAMIRSLLVRILTAAGHLVEAFEDAESLLPLLGPGDRGCITIDLNLPGMGGLALQMALKSRKISLPVLFISGSADIPSVVAAMKQGAIDFLTKPLEPKALLAAVEVALRKDEEAASVRAAVEHARARLASLSPREREVCELVGQGMLLKQVAAELGTREPTVHAQRMGAFKKLGVGSLVELIRLLDLIRAAP